MRRVIRVCLLIMVTTLLMGTSVFATDYTRKGTYRWAVENGLYYAYDAVTGELIRNCRVGKSYVDENGTRYLNRFVKGVYYNPKGIARKKFKGGWVKTGDKVYYFLNKKMVTGYKKIGSKYYYFSSSGERLSGVYYAGRKYRYFKMTNGARYSKVGWKTISGKRYYISANGVIKEGFFKIGKKKYYQTVLTGIVKGEQEIGGKKFYFKSNGVYDADMTKRIREASALGKPEDMLFFTKFESGSVGYAQTGGDSGKACGKYQFDYRYALIPFLKYCYTADPVFFAGFEPYLNISPGDKSLIGNNKLFKAWKDCYDANATFFSSMQDKYAEEAYYKPAETYLAAKGIHLAVRPYVIRGAVFSYSIQEGSLVAAQAVVAAGLNDSITNKEFLEKLYDYRWKDPRGWNRNSVFTYRYTQERALALSILSAAAAAG